MDRKDHIHQLLPENK